MSLPEIVTGSFFPSFDRRWLSENLELASVRPSLSITHTSNSDHDSQFHAGETQEMGLFIGAWSGLHVRRLRCGSPSPMGP